MGLPLVRAYFLPAEIGKVVASFMKNGDPVSLGSFVHVIGHKKDAQCFMKENGIPPFVWHLPGKGFKALRTLYRTKQQVLHHTGMTLACLLPPPTAYLRRYVSLLYACTVHVVDVLSSPTW